MPLSGVSTDGGRVVAVAAPAPVLTLAGVTATQIGLMWPKLSGVDHYRFTRSQPNTPDKVTELPSSQTEIPFQPSMALFPDEKMLPGTAGSYEVRAYYADGREGAARIPFTTLPAKNPPGLTATQTGVGKVRLQWARPNCCPSYFVVFGPGSSQAGVKVAGNSEAYEVTGAPGGSQEWMVASYYEPGPITTPAAEFSKVRLDVTTPVVSGRYLITITGLRAINMSFDDQLSRDGKGDEIYAANVMRRYDRRSGAVLETADTRTLTYGDTYLFGTSRVQAGTMSTTGGIRDGDPIPANSDPAVRSLPSSSVGFPLKVWEGTLRDGIDALVLSPTIWEQDGLQTSYEIWLQEMKSLTPSLWSRPEIQQHVASGQFGQLLFGTATLERGEDLLAVRTMGAILGYAHIVQVAQGEEDRPIGLYQSAVNDRVLPNAMVVLTREIIEAGLAPLPAGTPPVGLPGAWPRMPRPGVLMIPFIDGSQIAGLGPARYELYLTVERVP